MERTTIALTLHFSKGYIADPYRPELEELINIQKTSGMNRARTEKTRQEALSTHLQRLGMSAEDFAELETIAHHPWYRAIADDNTSEIVVPAHQLYGCWIEACKQVSANLRPCESGNFRHLIEVEDFCTGKTACDGVYKRLVMPKSGTGQPLSNQRALRANEYIADVEATGTVRYFAEDLRDNGLYLREFVAYAGQRIGVGASRKMGYGRYTVKSFTAEVLDLAAT